MVSQLEGKVLIWKQEVEQNKQALLSGEEIQQEQLPAMPAEDNMADFTKSAWKTMITSPFRATV